MDAALFEFINQDLANPILDGIMPVLREKMTWFPLYTVMLILLVRQFGWKRTGGLLLAIAVTILVADQLAASVLKPWVGRPRPCTLETTRALVGCGGIWSFPSNHATNHFALATVLALTWLAHYGKGSRVVIFIWAGLVSVAQVYVGKHYPSDIVAGAALGMSIAVLVVLLYRRWVPDPI